MTTNAFDREIRRFESMGRTFDALAIERQARALQADYVGAAFGRGTRSLGRRLATLAQRWLAYWQRRQAMEQLHQLDDRLLADIGLTRGNLLGQLLEAEAATAPQHGEVERIVGQAIQIAPAANANRAAHAA